MRAVRWRHTRSRGQALVEMAIAAPLLLVLILVVAQVGVIVYDQVTIDNAAREGARVGSEQPNHSLAYVAGVRVSPPFPSCPSASTNPVCVAVRNASKLLAGTAPTVTIEPDSAGASPATCSAMPSAVADGYVKVTVMYDAPVFVPLIGQFFQSSDSPGVRHVKSVVSARVEPCSLTQGN